MHSPAKCFLEIAHWKTEGCITIKQQSKGFVIFFFFTE